MPLSFRFVDCRNVSQHADLREEFVALGIADLAGIPVVHCFMAFGGVLQHVSGWKFVYSGDCRPSPALVAAGQNATVLVHDATFEDELLDEAQKRKHSTVTEALDVGVAMNAKHTILTHFSTRSVPVCFFLSHTYMLLDVRFFAQYA